MGINQQTRKRGADPVFPRLLGERLCLAFANSIESPRGRQPQDFLGSYADLVRWGRHVGVLADDEVDRLLGDAAGRPDLAGAVLQRAVALRAAITRVFRAIAQGTAPDEADLALLQAEYLGALTQARLAPSGGRFDWAWGPGDPALDGPLRDVVRSTVDVLTTDDLSRVKECPGAGDCGWLFYDTSKNASRRWCSMEGCGSRVKMRRQYARQRGVH